MGNSIKCVSKNQAEYKTGEAYQSRNSENKVDEYFMKRSPKIHLPKMTSKVTDRSLTSTQQVSNSVINKCFLSPIDKQREKL